MSSLTPPYIGNGHYCYANGAAMLLSSVGEQVSAGLIEVLTGMSLGATWNERLDWIFFDSARPGFGVTRALGLLGFEVTECISEDGEPAPLAELANVLGTGVALLGPLDMGLLLYQPGKGRASGVDHYVLAYGIDDAEVYLHDPAGYPNVSLLRGDLVAAWRAELIGYRQGSFHWWHSLHRVAHPSEDRQFRDALTMFADIYREADHKAARGACVGSAAIRRLAERVKGDDIAPSLAGHLRGFTFQVAARRALDFAQFFGQRAPGLAALKDQQARLFGRAHTLFLRQDWSGTAETLTALAAVEDQLRDQIIGAAVTA